MEELEDFQSLELTLQNANCNCSFIGGQTPLAAALTQVLHLLEPECKITVLCSMDDQYQLLQRAMHVFILGAEYTLDGMTPDLMEYLVAWTRECKGVDTILDAGGEIARREEVTGLLVGPKKDVDCHADDMVLPAMEELVEREDVIEQFERLLEKAVEAFEVVTEPGCPLEDE